MTGIERWTPAIDPREIDDLRARLRATRWPAPPGDDVLGVAPALIRPLLERWADGFDADAHVAALQTLPGHRTEIDGTAIHFLHAPAVASPGDAARPLPLLLLHGWPDSAWRYRRVIEPLTDPQRFGRDAADAFDLVIPDMPGFGFSEPPPGAPRDSRAVAGMWAELMTRLGYERFVVAGGDIGSHVARYLALDHPDRVIAVHRTDGGFPAFADGAPPPTPAEREWMDEVDGGRGRLRRDAPHEARHARRRAH